MDISNQAIFLSMITTRWHPVYFGKKENDLPIISYSSGNTVTCSIKISNVNGNNLPDNEQTRIAGIPFVMHANASNQTSAVTFTYNVAFQDDEQNCFIGGSSVSYLRGYRSRDTATWQPWYATDWRQSQIYLYLTITYLSTV